MNNDSIISFLLIFLFYFLVLWHFISMYCWITVRKASILVVSSEGTFSTFQISYDNFFSVLKLLFSRSRTFYITNNWLIITINGYFMLSSDFYTANGMNFPCLFCNMMSLWINMDWVSEIIEMYYYILLLNAFHNFYLECLHLCILER